MDAALGPGNLYHPIRVSRKIYDRFFEQFEEIYMYDGQTEIQRKNCYGEVGYYFIGRKL